MVVMREANVRDLPGAYEVCLATSNADGVDRQWSNPELLGHVYVGPYIVGPADVALVLIDADGIAGYCFGVADTIGFASWADSSWWPQLRADYPLTGTYPAPESECVGAIHNPPPIPERVIAQYPAHLHIDLLPRAQGLGWGRRLMDELLARVAAAGAPAIHLGVGSTNTNAIEFYHHLGFTPLADGADEILMGKALQ